MEVLGSLFVGTALLLLIGHAAEVLSQRARDNRVRRHSQLLYVLARRRSGHRPRHRTRAGDHAMRVAVPRRTGT